MRSKVINEMTQALTWFGQSWPISIKLEPWSFLYIFSYGVILMQKMKEEREKERFVGYMVNMKLMELWRKVASKKWVKIEKIGSRPIGPATKSNKDESWQSCASPDGFGTSRPIHRNTELWLGNSSPDRARIHGECWR